MPRFTAGTQILAVSWSGGPSGQAATTVTANGDGSYDIGPPGPTTIADGASHTYTLTVRYTQQPSATEPLTACADPAQPGHGLYNVVSLPEEDADKVDADNVACLDPAPAIRVVKTVARADETDPPTADSLTIDTGESVRYAYAVSLAPHYTEPVRDIALVDSPAVDIGSPTGDTDGDGVLDAGETWLYHSAAVAPTATVTNTATATGTGTTSGVTVSASGTATVAVLGLAKSAASPALPDESGAYAATYQVTVTNAGDAPATYGPIDDTVAAPAALTPTTWSWTGPAPGTTSTASGTFTGASYAFEIGAAGTTIGGGSATSPTTHTYTVTIGFTYAGDAAASGCGEPGGGLVNTVAWPGQSGEPPTDNTACVDPPTHPITVEKWGVCEAASPCRPAGSAFALYDTDPAGSGAVPVTDGIDATSEAGVFSTQALAVNRPYWLVETTAADGHHLLATPVAFTVTPAGIVLDAPEDHGPAVEVTGAGDLTLKVTDTPRGDLPAAGGGRGPIGHLAAGLLLVAAAAAIRLGRGPSGRDHRGCAA